MAGVDALFGEAAEVYATRAPDPGEHSHEVLRDFGLAAEEIADLAAARILG